MQYRIHEALAVVRSGEINFPIVVKAGDLLAGKAVVIAENQGTAEQALNLLARYFDQVTLEKFVV